MNKKLQIAKETAEIKLNDTTGTLTINAALKQAQRNLNRMQGLQKIIYELRKEDWIMEIKKIELKIKKRINELMDDGVIKSEALLQLKKEFKIPAKDISNFWIEVKEELYTEKCINDGNHEAKGKILREKQNKTHTEDKTVNNVIAPKEETESVGEATDIENNTFQVVAKEIILKGKYGTYKFNKENVQVGELKFNNLIDIEEYRKKEIAEFQKQIDEFNSHVEEIKAVFAYM